MGLPAPASLPALTGLSSLTASGGTTTRAGLVRISVSLIADFSGRLSKSSTESTLVGRFWGDDDRLVLDFDMSLASIDTGGDPFRIASPFASRALPGDRRRAGEVFRNC